MILTFLLQTIGQIIDWIPKATTLPFGVDSYFVSGMGMVRYVAEYVPPIGTLLTAFGVYVSFILLVKLIKLIPIVRNILN